MSPMTPRSSEPGCIALIPARSGSKRVVDKNIRELAGHPMLAYSIAAAAAPPSKPPLNARRESGLSPRIRTSPPGPCRSTLVRNILSTIFLFILASPGVSSWASPGPRVGSDGVPVKWVFVE